MADAPVNSLPQKGKNRTLKMNLNVGRTLKKGFMLVVSQLNFLYFCLLIKPFQTQLVELSKLPILSSRYGH